MKIFKSKLEGCILFQPDIFIDHRGAFTKLPTQSELTQNQVKFKAVEQYYSKSLMGAVRGMHFQVPPCEHAKIVTIISGQALDVVIDLRKSSKTYLQFEQFELDEKLGQSIYIPTGFAHGFQSKSNAAILLYQVSGAYSLNHDRGIHFESFGFNWPLNNKIISDKDLKHPNLADFSSPF